MKLIRLLSRAAIPLAMAFLGSVVAAQTQPAAAPTPVKNDSAASPMLDGPIDLTVTTKRRNRCGNMDARGEIVVCGADHGEDLKVPGSADDPNSHEALYNGTPSAPNVSGLPNCSQHKCIGIGKAPPKIYVIDLKSIPEAPKGSDADKVAKGEISDR